MWGKSWRNTLHGVVEGTRRTTYAIGYSTRWQKHHVLFQHFTLINLSHSLKIIEGPLHLWYSTKRGILRMFKLVMDGPGQAAGLVKILSDQFITGKDYRRGISCISSTIYPDSPCIHCSRCFTSPLNTSLSRETLKQKPYSHEFVILLSILVHAKHIMWHLTIILLFVLN